MKKIVSSCLTLLCVVILGLGFSACIVNPAAPEAAGSVDNIDSPTFSLEGDMFTLPFPMADLLALGWEFDDDEATVILEPEIESFESVYLVADGRILLVIVGNISDEKQMISEGTVIGIVAHAVYSNADIILPGGISLGSTYDEVIAAYGEAQSMTVYEKANIINLVFYRDNFRVDININNETDSVTLMNMDCSLQRLISLKSMEEL